jgi:hypothetical protein
MKSKDKNMDKGYGSKLPLSFWHPSNRHFLSSLPLHIWVLLPENRMQFLIETALILVILIARASGHIPRLPLRS